MIEASLRKWHRWLGLTIVLFVVLQSLTGLILNLEDLFEIPALTRWSKCCTAVWEIMAPLIEPSLPWAYWAWLFPVFGFM